MLHIINRSPFTSNAFSSCLRVAPANSSILLIEDGVYAALADTEFALLVSKHSQHQFFALAADIDARGITEKIITTIQIIDYSGFVDLTLRCHPIQSWS